MTFRKRRRPTPHLGIPSPFNPLSGDHDNLLGYQGIHPYCAMMQVAADDVYDDYVICRGFDPRIGKFIDYEEGNADKPGISVAKPWGQRWKDQYEIGEIHPAVLPTQGSVDEKDFSSANYVPPSPTAVDWRVGQNPGVVTGGDDSDGGQPSSLSDTVSLLSDHNSKRVNWLLVGSRGSGATTHLVQAPEGGIDPREGIHLGCATCTIMKGVEDGGCGLLEPTADTIIVRNWLTVRIMDTGERLGIASWHAIDSMWWAEAEDCADISEPEA